MKKYQLSLERYASVRGARDPGYVTNLELVRAPIQQLMARFDVRGKSILSIGAGDCFEERWMAPANKVTAVDISDRMSGFDEAFQADGPDQYIVQDAAEFIESCRDHFQLVYISSFEPDEYRREQLQQAWRDRRTAGQRSRHVTWEPGETPYHPVIESSLRLVRPGGLVILQHYRGGVNVVANPHYFRDVETQFSRHGVNLVEAHHFRASPQHLLLVAMKHDPIGVQRYRDWLRDRPAITTFHGRYNDPINRDVVRIDPPNPEVGWLGRLFGTRK